MEPVPNDVHLLYSSPKNMYQNTRRGELLDSKSLIYGVSLGIYKQTEDPTSHKLIARRAGSSEAAEFGKRMASLWFWQEESNRVLALQSNAAQKLMHIKYHGGMV